MSRRTRYNTLAAAVLFVLLKSIAPAAADVDPTIRAYDAVYQIEYKGRVVGRSEFSVRYDERDERYRFSSTSRFRGFLRFFSPKALIERSEFVSVGGKVTPLEFWFEDGSRRGNDNVHIAFDWNEGIATVTSDDRETNYPITQGALDPGALQVQVMLDIARSAPRDSYTLADEAGLSTYFYVTEADEVIETPLGAYSARAFVQEREGSSRQTFIWTAPELRQLPLRIEQKRNGETRMAFLLESVDWAGAPAD